MFLLCGTQGKLLLDGGEVVDVLEWELREEVAWHEYTSSATGSVPARLPGRRRLQGRCRVVLNTEFDMLGRLALGGTVTLKLYLDQSRYFEIPAQVAGLDLSKSKQSGEPDRLSFEFYSNGEWTRPVWS